MKDVLETRDHAGKEPSYEQTQTLEYVSKFAKLSKDKAESLYNNLLNLDGMNEEMASKFVDFLPEDVETAKLLLTKASALTDGVLGEAVELTKKHVTVS